jgi:hypothetical protein
MNNVVEMANELYSRVCGTPNDVMTTVYHMVEGGELEGFYENELEVLRELDTMMFNCDVCGWNCDMCELSWSESNMGSNICCYCEQPEDDENDG